MRRRQRGITSRSTTTAPPEAAPTVSDVVSPAALRCRTAVTECFGSGRGLATGGCVVVAVAATGGGGGGTTIVAVEERKVIDVMVPPVPTAPGYSAAVTVPGAISSVALVVEAGTTNE